ncbi:hypothetical protein [Streptomyces sp. NBC_00859]|uniref:hypothetical protein n=1 Tax=Streptomyces sp. NBC_00859 TaxID=2903682 RepID=UPI003864AD2E|nr:hypothetical protein OG584_00900 [Streptomyces sp. NBC_00859]
MTTEPAAHPHPATLAKAEFGLPGPLLDQRVTAIPDGTKTATTDLVADGEHDRESFLKSPDG